MAQGDVLVEYTQHGQNVNDGVWLDNKNVITASSDYALQKWDINGNKDYQITFSNQLLSMDINGDQTQAIVSVISSIGIADLTNQTVEKEITDVSSTSIRSIEYYNNFNEAIFGDYNGDLRRIDLETGDIIFSFPVGTDVYEKSIYQFGINEDKREIVVPQRYVYIYDLETQDQLWSSSYYNYYGTRACNISNDNTMFAYETNDNEILRVRDYETKDLILSIDFNMGVRGINFTSDDKYIVCSHYGDNLISIIEIETGNIYYQYSFDVPAFIKFSPDRTKIITGNYYDIAQIWETGLQPPPIDVTLTMSGYYSSSIVAGNITKESTTKMDGYYSKPIAFDMAKIVNIFRKILRGKITTKSNLKGQIKKEQRLKATIEKEGDLN